MTIGTFGSVIYLHILIFIYAGTQTNSFHWIPSSDFWDNN